MENKQLLLFFPAEKCLSCLMPEAHIKLKFKIFNVPNLQQQESFKFNGLNPEIHHTHSRGCGIECFICKRFKWLNEKCVECANFDN